MTKFTTSSALDGAVECGCFPSLTPAPKGHGLTGGYLKRRNTVVIPVGEAEFEIGPDVRADKPN